MRKGPARMIRQAGKGQRQSAGCKGQRARSIVHRANCLGLAPSGEKSSEPVYGVQGSKLKEVGRQRRRRRAKCIEHRAWGKGEEPEARCSRVVSKEHVTCNPKPVNPEPATRNKDVVMK